MTPSNVTDNRFLRRLRDRALPAARACLLLLVFALLLSGCAKTGAPQPPRVLIPRPAADLACRQYSDQVLLSVSVPVQNTDGSPASGLGALEVLRKVEERTGALSPVADAKFLAGAEIILSIDGDRIDALRRDSRLEFRDQLSLADRRQIYTKEFRYAVRFLNRKRQSAGLSNQSVAAPVPIPAAPFNLSAETTQDFIRLRWSAPAENMDGSAPARIVGYNVYRTEDPRSVPAEPLNRSPLPVSEYEDRGFQFDRTYYYSVSILGSLENPRAESLASPALAVSARDIFPPGEPRNLNAVVAGPVVLLLWVAPPEGDVAGYRIYRREGGEGEFVLLDQALVRSMNYRDESVRPGAKYYYRVTAVDTHNNEGKATEAEVEVP